MSIFFTSLRREEVGTISAVTRVFDALWCRVRGVKLDRYYPSPQPSPHGRGSSLCPVMRFYLKMNLL